MKDTEIISNITTLRVKMFTHNDLDGVSCALALKKLYNSNKISFNFEFIGYGDFDKIKKFFDINEEQGAKYYDYVFITDLNFTGENFIEFLWEPMKKFYSALNDPIEHHCSLFKKIFFIDHHEDSEKALRHRVNFLHDRLEYFNDKTYCASLQLFNFLVNQQSSEWSKASLGLENKKYNENKVWLYDYLTHVNNWDTFEWKNNNDLKARDLNLVFTHIKRSKFFQMQEQKDGVTFIFNKSETTLLNETMENIRKNYHKALLSSVVLDHIDEDNFPHPDIQYIVIRSDEDVSLICDILREDIDLKNVYSMFNIKYIVNISFKYGQISFRRVHKDINLAKIAQMYGGGGHEYAAGCVINGKNQLQMQRIILPSLEKYGEPTNLQDK